jgi:ubiquinol-cytochrome c reductase cytochrome c subunit
MHVSMLRGALVTAVLVAAGSGSVTAALALAQRPAPAAQPAPPGNAAAGRKIYVKVGCHSCHGNEGQGAQPTGPRIAPNPTPFAAFSRYVRAPRANMPPYGEKILTDQEIADIYAFLRAQPGPAKVDGLLPPL